MTQHFLADLTARGIVKQTTEQLGEALAKGPLTLYCGFDPTGDSLHVGSLFGLITLRRFQLAGHNVIALAGGATGMIGDPSGKTQERTLQTTAQIDLNLAGIRRDMERILIPGFTLRNNAEWASPMSVLQFLRDIGKHFTVNYMMAKESVRARLEDREHGISYTEFSYMLLQAWDFEVLYRENNCRLQVGGSDQWGNITAGIELIRRRNQGEAHGLTWPLLAKADGTKFGKSESGTVWLDPSKTSPYDFYQYWVTTSDEEVAPLLRRLSLRPLPELEALIETHTSAPEKRIAQKALAGEMVALVHGVAEQQKIEAASQALFQDRALKECSREELEAMTAGVPVTEITLTELQAGIGLLDLCVRVGLVDSKGMARRDLEQGAIQLNQERVQDPHLKVDLNHALHSEFVFLKKGKRNLKIVRLTKA